MASKTPSKVFREMSSARYLESVYELHVRRGRARGRDGIVPSSLYDEIADICSKTSKKMQSGTHVYTQYRERLVLKGQGKIPRVISIPTVRDRIVLRALADFLKGVYPAAGGVIPQVRVADVYESLRKGEFDSFVRLDVKEFFPSITHARVRAALTVRIKKKEVTQLILRAIRTPTVADRAKKRNRSVRRGVPQGLAISNMLAELVASPIDEKMCLPDRWAYFRFVDDVLVLCNSSDVDDVCSLAVNLFKEQGLIVHDPRKPGSKSSVGRIDKGFEYLGYIFNGRTISVRPASVYKVESALARSFTRFRKTYTGEADDRALARCEWFVNLAITGCIRNGIARGWLHYFRQMNDYRLLKRLDATVSRFKRRFDVPPRLRSKSFMRAYWAVNHPGGSHHGYVPNFDVMSTEEKRILLIEVFDGAKAASMTDGEVEKRFDAVIDRAVSEMERDIGSMS